MGRERLPRGRKTHLDELVTTLDVAQHPRAPFVLRPALGPLRVLVQPACSIRLHLHARGPPQCAPFHHVFDAVTDYRGDVCASCARANVILDHDDRERLLACVEEVAEPGHHENTTN